MDSLAVVRSLGSGLSGPESFFWVYPGLTSWAIYVSPFGAGAGHRAQILSFPFWNSAPTFLIISFTLLQDIYNI